MMKLAQARLIGVLGLYGELEIRKHVTLLMGQVLLSSN
jgi:hypothetical protein